MRPTTLSTPLSQPASDPHALAHLGVVLNATSSPAPHRATADTALADRTTAWAFTQLRGRTLIEFSISVITSLPHAGYLVIVVPDAHAAQALDLVEQVMPDRSRWEVSVVPGGRTRQESVRFGIDALPDSAETVLVHDAARPFASAELFEQVIAEAVRTGEAVTPVLTITDPLVEVDHDGRLARDVDHENLVMTQTPQAFRRETLAAAYAAHTLGDIDDADPAAIARRAGVRVRTVAGDPSAHRMTALADLPILEQILEANALGLGAP